MRFLWNHLRHHCRHIFFPEQFNQWFSNNVRCPVCRHDIRNTTIPSNPDLNLATNIIDQLAADLLTNTNTNTNTDTDTYDNVF